MTKGQTSNNPQYISAEALRKILLGSEEHAVLDVREVGRFDTGHLFWANNVPLSQLEVVIDARIPRRGVRIVLADEDDGLAERAATKLSAFGYGSVSILQGGVKAWKEAGFPLYKGVNVPSKAFGEFVEHTYGTPHIGAGELKALVDSKADVVILDSRPLPEFKLRSIPGGIDCPGAELPYRVHDLVKSPSTFIVVNCAGRTRSIIGAQSLINAGVPNRIAALKDGTMGWHLAGYKVASGETRFAPAPTEEGLKKAQDAVSRLAERFGVRRISESELDVFRGDESRTSYLFDVRQPEEYEAGHRPGARHAQGGQIVQATDLYVGTRHARIVLTDDTGVRATATAAWLIQLGWSDVYVLNGGLGKSPLEKGVEPQRVLGLDSSGTVTVEATQLNKLLGKPGLAIADMQTSDRYIAEHVPGAWFAIRSRLAQDLSKLPAFDELVLTSSDGVLATLAATDLGATLGKPVKVLKGGIQAWKAAGLPLEKGESFLASALDDVWLKPADRKSNVETAMQDYLEWESNLVRQIANDVDISFRKFPQAAQAVPS